SLGIEHAGHALVVEGEHVAAEVAERPGRRALVLSLDERDQQHPHARRMIGAKGSRGQGVKGRSRPRPKKISLGPSASWPLGPCNRLAAPVLRARIPGRRQEQRRWTISTVRSAAS